MTPSVNSLRMKSNIWKFNSPLKPAHLEIPILPENPRTLQECLVKLQMSSINDRRTELDLDVGGKIKANIAAVFTTHPHLVVCI